MARRRPQWIEDDDDDGVELTRSESASAHSQAARARPQARPHDRPRAQSHHHHHRHHGRPHHKDPHKHRHRHQQQHHGKSGKHSSPSHPEKHKEHKAKKKPAGQPAASSSTSSSSPRHTDAQKKKKQHQHKHQQQAQPGKKHGGHHRKSKVAPASASAASRPADDGGATAATTNETSFARLPSNGSLGAMLLSVDNGISDGRGGGALDPGMQAGSHYYPSSDLPSVVSPSQESSLARAGLISHDYGGAAVGDNDDDDDHFRPEELNPTFTLRRQRRLSRRRASMAGNELDLEAVGAGPRPGRGARYGRDAVDPPALQPIGEIVRQGLHDIGDTLRRGRSRRSRHLNPVPAAESRRAREERQQEEEDNADDEKKKKKKKKDKKEKGKKKDKKDDKRKKKSRFSFSGLTGTLRRKMKIAKGREKLQKLAVHRPFFTWWVSVTQVAVIALVLFLYDRAPINFETQTDSTEPLLQPDQSYLVLTYEVTANFWFGPRHEDLVILGAKYLPCMGKDKYVTDTFIKPQLELEQQMGCCINSGVCWSTVESDCQYTFDDSQMCGGPSCCVNPDAFPGCELRDDITSSERTCTCAIQARPCCYGLAGQCTLTTKETCESKALRGVFHPNKVSCQQANCLEDKCGLSPFARNAPDQWYRFFLAIFLHAGGIHLFVVLLLQFSLLPDVERIAGWWRVAFIYMISGAGGFVISGLFSRYQVTVGASGANFGILAALVVELVQSWKFIERPGSELAKLIVIIVLAFAIGILPYVDNYSHIGGFLFGMLAALAFLPHITFGTRDKAKKHLLSILALGGIVAAFVVLFTIFYAATIPGCSFCGYLNCVDLLQDFCANHGQASDEPLSIDFP
ncbi:hypothetical protein PTSG_07804 [Salpingoeca rosetta]|uniref:Peptidase S54 rhomboid domain-containing protein n=1 Tax=Salpingoeca rosetta (strain ATCC 50818 / BSB-021) TaxID=946362 RepID=F2UGD6_SALR5|nr:uncharacterized protein PTSG_07804 [Salpingoeca rosetta]EGD75686.1 hypothetical protein PTSG_07804 [Salpingoeca rosetta]|eukprot:XP_004991607.1 hypothetical protein PTSG_07804 [Salpingoeca rosetta]